MKVALFVHCFYPQHFYGTETYTLQVARNIQLLGHQVVVVSGVFQGEPRQSALITRYDYDGIPVVALDKNFEPHMRLRETYWHDAMRPHLRAVLAEIAPDVVHVTHLLNHSAVLLEEAKAAGYPLVATLTDFFGFCYNNRLEGAAGGLCAGPNRLRSNCLACHIKAAYQNGSAPLRGLERLPFSYSLVALGLRLAHGVGLLDHRWQNGLVSDVVERPGVLRPAYDAYDAMIAPTTFLRDAYRRNGFDNGRLHLSHFGVDLPRSPKPPRSTGEALKIGFIGQIAPHKGLHLLVDAIRSLEGAPLELRIYGDEQQAPSYAAQLRSTAGAETKFLGTFPSSQMSEVLGELDLVVIPSTWYENSPLVLLNALASHTPVLVSNVEGMTEFITQGQNGWTFRRGDGADLRRVLRQLVANPELVRDASRKTSYDRTTLTMTEEIVRIYEEIGARPRGRKSGVVTSTSQQR